MMHLALFEGSSFLLLVRVFKSCPDLKNKMPRGRFSSRSRSRSRALSRGRTGPVASRPGYRSRTFRGSTSMTRSRASRSLNTHSFSRYCPKSAFGNFTVTTSTYGLGWEFRLSDVVNYSEFTTLFDQFMLTKCVVTLRLVTNPDSAAVTNLVTPVQITNWYPQVWYVPDYDDSGAETLDSIKERIGVKRRTLKPDSVVRIVIRPKILVQTYVTAIATGYAPKRMFVDCDQSTVPHYGLKTVIDCMGLDPSDTYPFVIAQERQYFFTLKNVR